MARLVSNLSKIAAQARHLAAEALKETGEDIADLTKQLAPVKTGRLRDSYRVEVVDESTVRVGSDVDYSVYQEYGTVNMAAQPHLTPAFMQSEATFKARLTEKMRKLGQ
jgi:HK97 gp10 family phage protein